MTEPLRFLLLGPVTVIAGQTPLHIDRPRQRAVLAYLLLHPNQLVTTDRLVDAVWGGASPATARTQVQSDISAIRRVLDAAAAPNPVSTRPAGYAIAVDPGRLDTAEFADAIRQATAETDRERAVARIRQALTLWRGQALADVDAAFVESCRDRLEEQRLHAYQDLFAHELALGRHAGMIAELTSALDANPMHEGLTGQLMLALYRNGRQAEALRVARALRHTLADQHGIEPGHRFRELERAILRNDRSLDLVDGSAPAVFAEQRPPARPVPAQLPPAVTEFVGREDQHRLLDDLMSTGEPGAPKIAAVFGPAGVGKTALVIRWAHSVADRFPDGQLYIDMRGYSSDPPLTPFDALSRFLRAVGLPADQIPMDSDEAASVYRTALATRRILVVIDNARHVEQVRPLLPTGPGCLCLVTSRTRLGGLVAVNAARPVTLDVLSPQDSVALIGRIIGADRVTADPDAAAELADACGHLPLAVRIAAAQILLDPDLTVTALVTALRPGRRLATLSIPDDQHASVQAAFDCSYRSLEPALRRMFRLLGVAPGDSVTVAAAAVLAGASEPDAAAALERLAGAHLVNRIASRYTFHDLVREYAAGLPEDTAGESATAVSALLTWQLRAVDAAMSLISPPAVSLPMPEHLLGPAVRFDSPAEALAWLDGERANLVEAIRQAPTVGRPEVAWLLAGMLRGYFRRGMHTAEWLVATLAAVDAAREAAPELRPRVLALLELSLGLLYQTLGRQPDAVAHFTDAAAAARETGWLDLEASALGNLGVMAWRAGDLTTAVSVLRQGVDVARLATNVGVEANNLGNLAIITSILGRLEEAATSYLELIPLFRTTGSRDGEAHATNNLADVSRLLGRLRHAIRYGAEAARLFREIGDAQEAAALAHVAAAHSDLGQFDQAARVAREALAIASGADHRYLEVDCLDALAYACRGQGDLRASLAHAERAVQLAVDLDSPDLLSRSHRHAADALLALGRPDDAETYATSSLALAQSGNFRLNQAEALMVLAEIASARGDQEAVGQLARQASTIADEAGLALLVNRARNLLGGRDALTGTTALG